MDGTDTALLIELQGDARLSLAELGRRVGLSSPAVAERLRRLEDSGVIVAHRAELNPEALGLALTSIIRIRPTPRQLPKVAELAKDTPEIVECHRITGEDCFLMKVHAPTIADLEAVLDQFLLYGQTVSSIVVSSPVPPRPLPVPTAPDGTSR